MGFYIDGQPPHFSNKISQVGIRKALNLSKGLAINRSPEDMEFLISRWSIKSRTFITVWGEFCPTLEDVVVFLSVFIYLER